MLQYHPSNPMRPVDWRWERARIIRETKYFRLRNEDEWTQKTVKFQKQLLKCKNEFDRYTLMCKEPDIYFAYNIRGAIGTDIKKVITIKDEIEARLLAGEDDQSIADKAGCSVATVNAFEHMFFSVKDKLKNTTYILHQVLGPAIHRGLYERDHDLLWKLYGYFCGSRVIDALTTTFTNPVRPNTPEEVDAMFVDDTRETMRRKAALAARTVGVNEHTQLAILQTYAQFLEIEQESVGTAGESTIIENIKVMMTGLPWTTGSAALASSDHKLLTHYDKQGAELRADEILAISAGMESLEHEDLTNIKFPEAPAHEKDVKGR